MLQNYLTTFTRVLLRQKVYSAINVFGLALGIACFGLFGLVTYMATRRTKEICIRKVSYQAIKAASGNPVESLKTE